MTTLPYAAFVLTADAPFTFSSTYPASGTAPHVVGSEYITSVGIGTDAQGVFYLTDIYGSQNCAPGAITVLASDGTFIYCETIDGTTQLDDAAVGPNSHVYVVDRYDTQYDINHQPFHGILDWGVLRPTSATLTVRSRGGAAGRSRAHRRVSTAAPRAAPPSASVHR